MTRKNNWGAGEWALWALGPLGANFTFASPLGGYSDHLIFAGCLIALTYRVCRKLALVPFLVTDVTIYGT